MSEQRQSILIVDDTRSNVEILLTLLDEQYDLSVALNGEDALEFVAEQPPDLILLDIMMPGMDGFTVCQRLKKDEKTSEIPIIFITGKSDEESIEKAFDVGGVDYITKPFKPKELLARVRTHLELRRLIHDLEYISSHDKLTGLYNRGRFFTQAKRIWNEQSEGIYAGMLDIDKFKSINDRFGHPMGDLVIIGVAQTIKKVLGSNAVYGRIGGEEFAVLWPATDDDRLTSDLEAIRRAVEELHWTTDQGEQICCTISCGAAGKSAAVGSLDELLKIADEALYSAKGEGRNRSILRA